MADEQPSLQIDNDWKKQAQEEKRKLAEKAQEAKAATPSPGSSATPTAKRPGERETPTASFPTLVQQLMTQALVYLGEMTYRGSPPMLDLDMARYQHDLLTMIEQKTANNLTEVEQLAIDTALHEVRTRFIRTASEYATV